MFDWLANLLVKIPIQGHACACCEAKKEKLKQMQKLLKILIQKPLKLPREVF